MKVHYSQPKGFVGRNICYSISYDNQYYGHIVAGSATLHLKNRPALPLENIVNNIFFHIEPVENKYPTRNFVPTVLKIWREQVSKDWQDKYGNNVLAFESLVELPRTGECYKRDKWKLIGQTIGYTCKRIGGKGTDSWSGKRIWNTKELRPKLIFFKEN